KSGFFPSCGKALPPGTLKTSRYRVDGRTFVVDSRHDPRSRVAGHALGRDSYDSSQWSIADR
ncbi:MAG: hypothetical protein DME50_17430, partial [Verrucomicrobia bacterium]